MKRLLGVVLVCLLCASFAIAAEKETKKEAKQPRFVEVAGVVVEIDPATGRMRPLSAEERQTLLKGLDKFLSRPTQGLRQTESSAGETTVDISDTHQHALISFVADGEVRTICVEDLNEALAALFPAETKASAPAKRETE